MRKFFTGVVVIPLGLIFLIFAGVTGVLWIGARDVRAGLMTVGELVQFVIYSIMVAGSVGALSEVWGELQRAAGATERLGERMTMAMIRFLQRRRAARRIAVSA